MFKNNWITEKQNKSNTLIAVCQHLGMPIILKVFAHREIRYYILLINIKFHMKPGAISVFLWSACSQKR